MKEQEIRPKELYKEFKILVEQEVFQKFANIKMEERGCPVCDGNDFKAKFEKFGFTYYDCKHCSSIYVNPVPEDRLLDEYYTDSDAIRFFADRLYEETKEVRKDKIFKNRKLAILALAKKFNLQQFKVIDIGGGSGLLADVLNEIHIPCEIIEPSISLAAICRSKGLTVHNVLFKDFNFPLNDTVPVIYTSFELVEHLKDPIAFFKHAEKGLRTGDFLYFTTLNGNGFDLRLLWEKSDTFLPPLHLFFINPYAVEMLAQKYHFEVISIETPGRLDVDIVNNAFLDRHVDLGQYFNFFMSNASDSQKSSFQNWLVENKLSSHIQVILKKV